MASDQEYATYSETGETFKDKGCQVLSVRLAEERGDEEERGAGSAGSGASPAPEQAQDRRMRRGWSPQCPALLGLCP